MTGENRRPPKFSVITVVWNNLDGLKQTTESLRRQTYRDFEHVVIDGGSTDGTKEWLEGYEADYPIVAVSEPDRGLYDAMNKGIWRASGDLVVFMNGADTFTHDDDLEFVAHEWVASDWMWGYGAVRHVNADREAVKGVVHAPFVLRKYQLGFMWVPHQSSYFALEALREFNGFRLDVGVSGDQELTMRIATKYRPAVWVRFVSDFLIGGVHSSGSDFATELRWHKIRVINGFPVAGSRVADWFFAVFRGALRQGRRAAGDSYRRLAASRQLERRG